MNNPHDQLRAAQERRAAINQTIDALDAEGKRLDKLIAEITPTAWRCEPAVLDLYTRPVSRRPALAERESRPKIGTHSVGPADVMLPRRQGSAPLHDRDLRIRQHRGDAKCC